jgi:membrane glycosyltransferase
LHAAGASAFDVAAVGVVFGVGLAFLLAPKILACLEMLRTGEGGRFGGAPLAALNVAIESLLSMLVAPLIMVSHTCSLAAVVAGRDSGWVAQAREETGLNLLQMARLHAADTVLGLMLTVLALSSSVRPFLWMTPVIAGLALAIPLASAGASGQLGRTARRAGLLLVPEEQRPPQILARANAIAAGWPNVFDASAEVAFSALQRGPGASSRV